MFKEAGVKIELIRVKQMKKYKGLNRKAGAGD
jgi:hypothetical protein